MITLTDFWMGRDRTHGTQLSTDIRRNADTTVEQVNKLLVLAKTAGVTFETNPRTGSLIASGWRPPDINAGTPGAAAKSKHMTGQACDVYDPDGDLDDWLMTDDGQRALKDLGLWMEHPSATKGWAHVQTVPPRSGHRVFYP